MSLMRTYRAALTLSQSAFAARLNVPLETYRTWDSGRREPSKEFLSRARTLAAHPDDTVLLSLRVLALMIGVHVRTLQAAARSGRLAVVYDTRTTFRRLRPRATLKEALVFDELRPSCATSQSAVELRLGDQDAYDLRRLGLSQSRLAHRIGAAGKAVVYQWESRRRVPSPVFWRRVEELESR